MAAAFSGGSDSLALLCAALAWARPVGRKVVAVVVDHRLQPLSEAWTRTAAAQAQALGAQVRVMAWTGPKPATGLPAAARTARHRLLAQAAREAGASVVLVGHTRDDLLETALMREAGSSLGIPGEWSPSPVWPEGRGVFHFRPLLDLRRADLRRALAAEGLDWIEDPANEDPRYARARARAALAAGAVPPRDAEAGGGTETARLAAAAEAQWWGGFRLDRRLMAAAAPAAATRVLAAALTCASGRETPPRGDRVRALLERLCDAAPFKAALGGARIEAAETVLVMREAGDQARSGLAPMVLAPGRPAAWDGRFELAVRRPDLHIRPLRGLAGRLGGAEHAILKAVPPGGRGALPAILAPDGTVDCPVLAGVEGVDCLPLWEARMRAACGLVAQET